MLKHCAGVKNITSPQVITIRTCLSCGGKADFFSEDLKFNAPPVVYPYTWQSPMLALAGANTLFNAYMA